MQNNQLTKIYCYRDALISSNEDNNFAVFLNSLTEEETSIYLYIESKRVESFLTDLGLLQNNCISENEIANSHQIKSKNDFNFLIKFIKDLSEFPKPSHEERERIITKYNKLFKKLTDVEQTFFLHC